MKDNRKELMLMDNKLLSQIASDISDFYTNTADEAYALSPAEILHELQTNEYEALQSYVSDINNWKQSFMSDLNSNELIIAENLSNDIIIHLAEMGDTNAQLAYDIINFYEKTTDEVIGFSIDDVYMELTNDSNTYINEYIEDVQDWKNSYISDLSYDEISLADNLIAKLQSTGLAYKINEDYGIEENLVQCMERFVETGAVSSPEINKALSDGFTKGFQKEISAFLQEDMDIKLSPQKNLNVER